MNLNIPDIEPLLDCKNLLIAGMGGGYDVYCALPLYLALRDRGQTPHLASYSFAMIDRIKGGERLSDYLVGLDTKSKQLPLCIPELYLAEWFENSLGEETVIWCLGNTGAHPLLENYRLLASRLELDGILLVDGGVDGLMRGDEAATGTILEDSCSLYAVSKLDSVPLKRMACLGLGAEDNMAYAHVFENIAAITKEHGFIGSCSLTEQMPVYGQYEGACRHAFERMPSDPSVINASVLSAVRGCFGNYHLTEKTRGSRLWISPLMAIYWFFDLMTVANRSLILDVIAESDTISDAFRSMLHFRTRITARPNERIPL